MKKTLFTSLFLGMIPLLIPSRSQAVTLTVSPTATDVTLGNQVDVNLIVSDLNNGLAPSLGAFDIDFDFDKSILDFESLSFGDSALGNQLDLFSLGSINGFLEVFPSRVNLFEISLDSPEELDSLQADSLTLATLSFNTIGEGQSRLELANILLGDAVANPLSVDVINSAVKVSSLTRVSVPESRTDLSLLLLGCLTAIGHIQVRKRSNIK